MDGPRRVIDWLIWAAAGVAMLIAELLLPGVFMLYLGLAACAASALTWLLGFNFVAQVVTFALLSGITLTTGLLNRGSRAAASVTHDSFIGQPATALVFEGRDGRVRLGDTDWPARVPPDVPPPDPGARMRVEKVDGTVVIVRPELRSSVKGNP